MLPPLGGIVGRASARHVGLKPDLHSMNHGINYSTATNSDNNFQPIPIRQLLRGKQTARHDLAVALQCDALARQAHLFDECGNTGGIGKLAHGAVNADGNHF